MPFIGTAIAAISGWVTAQTVFVQALLRIGMSLAVSAIQVALQAKPRAPGIRTQETQTGGSNPATFILGTYATSGTAVCPKMSHGQAGRTPLAYLTYVIDLGDIPMPRFGRLIINGEYIPLGTVEGDYGLPLTGVYAGNAWLKYYDGSQTTASSILLRDYAAYSARPWQADMILRGVPYAVLTFLFNRELFATHPTVRFENPGIALYDPRKDTSVGGAGAHRWSNPATWETSDNLVLQSYNVLRGISLPSGDRWGGEATHAEVPMANWVAAMNKADAAITFSTGETDITYRGGLEVGVDELPIDVLDELMKGCSGRIAEAGGIYKVRVGAPDLPLYFFDDEDIIITDAQEFDPFPGLDQTFNAIHASYPEPRQLWETKDAQPRYNSALEALDQNRRLTATLNLPAVPYGNQVNRLMLAYLNDQRRFRTHQLTLPPDAAKLEALDTVSWTSIRNGYSAKLFDVHEVADNQATLLQRLSLRERDPSDYDPPLIRLPDEGNVHGIVRPPAQTVPGFDLLAETIEAAGTRSRRPALRIIWVPEGVEDVRAIEWQVRVVGKTKIVSRGSTSSTDEGEQLISTGILPFTAYEARARLVVNRARTWTGWMQATTGSVFLKSADMALGGVHQTRLAQIDTSRVFHEPWTYAEALDEWEIVGNVPELVIVTESTAQTGGKSLRVGNNSGNDQLRFVSNVLIPFDPTRTYKTVFRARQSVGVGITYVGYLGIAADGVTPVGVDGSNNNLSIHWHGLTGELMSATHKTFTGYTKGYGATVGTTGAGTSAAPGKMHPDVRFLRPTFVVNFNGLPGQAWIDSLTIDTVISTATLEENSVTLPQFQYVAGSLSSANPNTDIAEVTNADDLDAANGNKQVTFCCQLGCSTTGSGGMTASINFQVIRESGPSKVQTIFEYLVKDFFNTDPAFTSTNGPVAITTQFGPSPHGLPEKFIVHIDEGPGSSAAVNYAVSKRHLSVLNNKR